LLTFPKKESTNFIAIKEFCRLTLKNKRFIIIYMRYLFIFLALLFFLPFGFSETLISRIDIKGNKIVSDATIISKIRVRANEPFNENIINEDIKNLYATGFLTM